MPKKRKRPADFVRREIENGLKDYQELREHGLLQDPTGPPQRQNHFWPADQESTDLSGALPFDRLCILLSKAKPQALHRTVS